MVWLYMILATIVGIIFHQFYWRRRNYPPGPVPLPIYGNALLIANGPYDFPEAMVEMAKKYGPLFTMWLGSEPLVMLNDYDTIKELFIKHGELFESRPDNVTIFEIVHGGKQGIILTSGDLWKEQRRFSLHVLRDFGVGKTLMEDRIVEETHFFIQALQDELLTNQDVVKPYVPIQICIGNIINNLVFGSRFEEDQASIRRIRESLDEANTLNTNWLMFGLNYPWTRRVFVFNRVWQLFDAFRANTFGFFDKQIAEHRRRFDAEAEPTDYVSAYMKEMADRQAAGDAGGFSDQQLHAVVFDIWIAGQETTVTTLHWAIFFMLHYPECQQKEVQRRANILPLNFARKVENDMTILGHKVLAGTSIIPQIAAVMWDERYFPNPKRFDPERFLEDGRLKKVDQLLPFSVGKRACMGEALARMELFVIFANFAQKFSVGKAPGAPYPPLVCCDKFHNKALDYACKLTVRQ